MLNVESRLRTLPFASAPGLLLALAAGQALASAQEVVVTEELLTARGLRFVEDPTEADLAIAFTVGSRDGIRITSYPTTSFQRGPRARRGYWGGSNVRTRQYTEGQLAVDLFDVAKARPVWHGTVASRVTRGDRAEPNEIIREALEAILAEFPPI